MPRLAQRKLAEEKVRVTPRFGTLRGSPRSTHTARSSTHAHTLPRPWSTCRQRPPCSQRKNNSPKGKNLSPTPNRFGTRSRGPPREFLRFPSGRTHTPPPPRKPPHAHLVVVVLAEAEALREEDGEGRAGEGRPEPELLRRRRCRGSSGTRRAALDVVVLGEAHALMRANAVVAQVLLAVEAARRGCVALVAGAATVRPAQQQRGRGGSRSAGRGAGRRGRRRRRWERGRRGGRARVRVVRVVPVVAVAARARWGARTPILGRRLVGGGHHRVEQVAEQESGRGQRVHARRFGQHYFLVAHRAAQLEWLSRRAAGCSRHPMRLEARAAEGVQAGQDVQAARRSPRAPATAPRRRGRLRGRRRRRRVGGERHRRAAHLLAQQADLEVGLRERSHLQPGPEEGGDQRGRGGEESADEVGGGAADSVRKMHRLDLQSRSRHQSGAARSASPRPARALPPPTLRALNATIQRRHRFLPEDVGVACLPKRERRNKS